MVVSIRVAKQGQWAATSELVTASHEFGVWVFCNPTKTVSSLLFNCDAARSDDLVASYHAGPILLKVEFQIDDAMWMLKLTDGRDIDKQSHLKVSRCSFRFSIADLHQVCEQTLEVFHAEAARHGPVAQSYTRSLLRVLIRSHKVDDVSGAMQFTLGLSGDVVPLIFSEALWWMWADPKRAVFGPQASQCNMFRWSARKSQVQVVKEFDQLIGGKHTHRPIRVRYGREEFVFSNVVEARQHVLSGCRRYEGVVVDMDDAFDSAERACERGACADHKDTASSSIESTAAGWSNSSFDDLSDSIVLQET